MEFHRNYDARNRCTQQAHVVTPHVYSDDDAPETVLSTTLPARASLSSSSCRRLYVSLTSNSSRLHTATVPMTIELIVGPDSSGATKRKMSAITLLNPVRKAAANTVE